MTFFVIHHTATGTANTSTGCPAGTYQTYFDPVNGPCFRSMPASSAAPGGTVGVIVRAAAAVGMMVHLGLAEQEQLGPVVAGKRQSPLYGLHANVTVLRQYQAVQAELARALWSAFGASGTIAGIYTGLEEPQNHADALPDWQRLAANYFQPLAHYIKTALPPAGAHPAAALTVWSSPDAVGNFSRYPRADMLGPRLIGDLWEQMFIMAPDFDLIALQDSQGERGQNSWEDTAAFLGNSSAAAARQSRAMWSNVELFVDGPPSCRWSRSEGHCHGRAPAPMPRILAQIQLAATVLGGGVGGSSGHRGPFSIVAWEWTSCLSPNGGTGRQNITRLSAANFHEYASYIHGSPPTAEAGQP